IVGLMGFWEDHKGLSAATRFFIQCLCAIGTLFFLQEGGYLLRNYLPFAIPLPIAFFCIVFLMVWMVNLYNFMDGSDGMAAVQGIFIFSMGGFFLFQAQGFELTILAWGLVALLA
ncbi:MAG TPA: hypothetical protein PLD88_01390, partial [Candidatus Berkiella sp.]|nr:hypothetical protein [Candidatus Berkiella sp.]